MTDTNQKLREVATELDRLMLVIESAVRHADPRNHASVMALILANKEALALPTADHIPDAGKMVVDQVPYVGKMIETAAPAGERELPPLPDPTYIYHDAEQGEDDLFEFSESGAVDEGCAKCKRLYTADQMRAYARAALSAGDAGWQPIETAPKDGTNVLLVNRKGNQAAGLWMDSLSGEGWYLRGGNHPDTFFNDHHGPTHWMPLPPPPSAIRARGEAV